MWDGDPSMEKGTHTFVIWLEGEGHHTSLFKRIGGGVRVYNRDRVLSHYKKKHSKLPLNNNR